MSREHMNSLHLRFRTSRLVGGVLLVALLALVPSSSASAYKAVFDNLNSSNTFYDTSSMPYVLSSIASYGCSWGNYYMPGTNTDLNNTYTLLDDHLTGHYCSNGVRFSGSEPHAYYPAPLGTYPLSSSVTFNNNVSVSSSSFDYYGYLDDHNASNYSTMPLSTVISRFNLKLVNHNDSTSSVLYPNVSSSLNNPYFIGHFSFALNYPNSGMWSTGFQPTIDASSLRIKRFSDDVLLSDSNSAKYNSILDSIRESIVFTCNDSFDESILPPGLVDTSKITGDVVCSIFFELPAVSGYYYDFSDQYGDQLISFSMSGSIPGYDDWITNDVIDDYDPIRFMFRNNFYYGQPGSKDNFAMSSPYFQLFVCEDQYECDYLNNLHSLLKDNRSQLTQRPTDNSSAGGSIFDSWWSVFGFNFLFPFRSLFGSFTDQSCVEIPIIAGMVHSSNSTYCSWFPASVKNVATPVLVSIAMMVLTGFIYSWLRDSDRMSISVSKGGNS